MHQVETMHLMQYSYCLLVNSSQNIGVTRIFSEGAFSSSKSYRPFLVAVLNTQPKSAELTSPALQLPAQQKFPLKLTSCSAWGCTCNLTL